MVLVVMFGLAAVVVAASRVVVLECSPFMVEAIPGIVTRAVDVE